MHEHFEDYKEIVLKHKQIKESYKKFYIIWGDLFLKYFDNITEKNFSKSKILTNFTKYLYDNNKY